MCQVGHETLLYYTILYCKLRFLLFVGHYIDLLYHTDSKLISIFPGDVENNLSIDNNDNISVSSTTKSMQFIMCNNVTLIF